MIPKVVTDAEIIQEAIQILMANMPPSKVARVLAVWKAGSGDYLFMRDELFKGDTLKSLVSEMKEMECQQSKEPR